MSLSILVSHTTHSPRRLSMGIVLTLMSSGCPSLRRLMLSCMDLTRPSMVEAWPSPSSIWLVVPLKSSTSEPQKSLSKSKTRYSGKSSRSITSKASWLDAPMSSRTRAETNRRVLDRQVSSSIMRMVCLTSVMSMDFNSWESVTLGVKESGLASSLMKMRLGMTTKALKKSSTMSSVMMAPGGWGMKTGAFTLIRCTFARYSPKHGASSPSQESGEATQPVVLIQSKQTEMRRTRTQTLNLTLMIAGSIIHSIVFQLQNAHNSSYLWCKRTKIFLRDLTSLSTLW